MHHFTSSCAYVTDLQHLIWSHLYCITIVESFVEFNTVAQHKTYKMNIPYYIRPFELNVCVLWFPTLFWGDNVASEKNVFGGLDLFDWLFLIMAGIVSDDLKECKYPTTPLVVRNFVCFLWMKSVLCFIINSMFPGIAGQAEPGKVTQAAKKLGRKMLTLTSLTADMSLRMLQYFTALRFFFWQHQYIPVSVDGSRIGGLSRLIGMISRPDGTGGWFPPQAIHSRM